MKYPQEYRGDVKQNGTCTKLWTILETMRLWSLHRKQSNVCNLQKWGLSLHKRNRMKDQQLVSSIKHYDEDLRYQKEDFLVMTRNIGSQTSKLWHWSCSDLLESFQIVVFVYVFFSFVRHIHLPGIELLFCLYWGSSLTKSNNWYDKSIDDNKNNHQ